MAILNFTNFGTGDNADAQSSTGTNSVQSSVVDTGSYALRTNPVTTAVGNVRMAQIGTTGITSTALNVATLYHRFRFRVDTAPASAEEQMYVVLDSGASDKCYLTLSSARVIKAYNASATLIATGTTVLTLGTWYTIELQTSTAAGTATFILKINSVDEFNTTATQGSNNHGSVRLGKGLDLNAQSVDFYYANWIVSDSAFIGVGQSDRCVPNANGTTQDFTAGTGASNYLEVDEVPADNDTTYVASNGAAAQTALFDCAAMPSATSINAVKIFAKARSVSGVSSTKIRGKSGATTSDGTAADWTTSFVNRFKIFTTDPATGSAWTQAGVDAFEAGIVEGNAIVNRLTAVAIFVDYVPGGGGGPISQGGLSLMGIGT